MKACMWFVTLTDGSDWKVRATSQGDAIKRAKSGKGTCVGCYFNKAKRAKATRAKGGV